MGKYCYPFTPTHQLHTTIYKTWKNILIQNKGTKDNVRLPICGFDLQNDMNIANDTYFCHLFLNAKIF